ncbi:MAG: PocR ligand-binding domain-containing protein, partial [Eubacteriaceae bacterium]
MKGRAGCVPQRLNASHIVMMRKINLLKLTNINLLKKITENIYEAAGIPVGIIDVDGTIIIETGWQDICTKFHRKHPDTCKNCFISDQYIKQHLKKGTYTEYKCLNNMWDIAMPIIVAREHLATVFLGQFFYEDEVIDIEVFRSQALKYGFDEKEYLDALSKVPRFSRKKVEHIMEYYSGLVMTLTESALRKLKYREKKIELQKNKKYLNQIINSVSDAIFIHDIYGNINDVNETATSMFGYSRNELLNMNLDKLFILDSDYSQFMEMLVHKARMKNPLIQEFNVKNKSNDELWV